MCTRCLGEFSVMWVTKLMIPQVKKRIFCPKTTKFGPNLAFLVDMGQAMQVFSVPCWWVSWRLWRAGCISQDTYLLYDGIIEEGGYIAGGQLVVEQYGKKGWRRVLITRGRNGTATTRHFSSTVLLTLVCQPQFKGYVLEHF